MLNMNETVHAWHRALLPLKTRALRADTENAETELTATEFEEPLTASSVRYATKKELSLDR
jgi:hypothetical protein